MLHFRSPAVDRDLDPAFGLVPGSPKSLGTFSVSGFAPSVMIATDQGPIAARDLTVGMCVETRDNGFVPIRWVGESMNVYDPANTTASGAQRGPVRIKAGAAGTDPEGGNLVVNAGHRVLVRNPVNALYFGADEVMADLGDLTHLEGVDYVTRSVMRFKHVLLETHELIRANGIWMESFSPEMWSIQVGFPEQWAEITTAVPRLRYESGEANYITPRMSLDTREASLIDMI